MGEACKKRKRLRYVAWGVLMPLLLGAVAYLYFCQDVWYVRLVRSCLPWLPQSHVALPRLVRNYFFDALWAYALMAAVQLNANHIGVLWRLLSVALLECGLEGLQLFPGMMGTFDICDIGVELLADAVAIIMLRRNLK